jgi:hypothetical protein
MTCKDAINSDISSEDKKWYLVNENTRYNKDFKFDLEGTTDQNNKIKRNIQSDIARLIFI